mgnify:CR=1 FL=1
MAHPPDLRDWFPDPMSDEAAYAVYLFLEQFTQAFEECYAGHLRRYIEDARQAQISQQLQQQPDTGCQEDDQDIPF